MSAEEPTPLRVLIVDDEELARQYLRELLRAHPQVTVVGECRNGFEAVKAVQEHAPDLVFLDIQMPKLDGFEVLELLEPAPAVVFVTAYDEYALKAFEVHAVDYLLKPFTPERLADALTRVRPGAPDATPLPTAQALAAEARPPEVGLSRVVVKDGARIVVIPVAKLDYVEAQDDYIALHSEGESWLKHQSITSLEQGLDPTRFLRIHRSVLVNVERIERVEPHGRDTRLATLQDGTELPVSRAGYKRLRSLLEK